MRKLQINVTEEDIQNSIKKNSRSCMIAHAIKRDFPDLSHISVDIRTIRVSDLKTREQLTFLIPRFPAVEMLCAFDEGEEVKPFSFKVTSPTVRKMRMVTSGKNKDTLQRVGSRAVIRHPKDLTSKYRIGVYRVHGMKAIGRAKPENPAAAVQDK